MVEPPLNIRVGYKSRTYSPDYVLLDHETDEVVPGKPYAVIEVKRDDDDGDGARQQAQFYADHLRVPIYVVVDGTHIHLWERRLVQADFSLGKIPVSDLSARKGELLQWLGRTQLPDRARELGRPDDADDQSEADRSSLLDAVGGNINRQARGIRLHLPGPAEISPSEPDGDLEGLKTAEYWWGPVNQPSMQFRKLVIEMADQPPSAQPELVDLVARLYLHDSLNRLEVDSPDAWKRLIAARPLLVDDLPANGGIGDAVNGLGSGPAGKAEPLLPWVDTLSKALDKWMLDRLRLDLQLLMAGEAIPDLSLEGWTKKGLTKTMLALLKQSGKLIELDIPLVLAMVAGSRDDAVAHYRLGPRSRQRLLEGVLFGFALACTLDHVYLVANDPTLNVRHSQTGKGLVYCLHGINAPSDIIHSDGWILDGFSKATLLALTRTSRSRVPLLKARQMGASLRSQLIGRAPEPQLIFTLDDNTRASMSSWEDLCDAIHEQYKEIVDGDTTR